jgi:LysM repeat protein
MKPTNYILTTLTLLISMAAFAQKKDSSAVVTYIKQYKDIAIDEMKRAAIPASITLAQGIHESSFGTSYLAKNTNNHFGIKCKETWTGKTFKYTDDAPNECFRVYDKVEDSYKDHSDFLRNRPYYTPLFKLDIYDYKAWAHGLKKSGYATNPKYAEILIKTIEDYQLYAFDKGELPSYISPLPKSVVVEQEEDEFYNVTDSMQIDVQKTIIQEKKTEVLVPANSSPVIQTQAQPVTTKKINKSIFKVNNCKAVKIYTAKGETLDLIGNVLKIEKKDLLAFNDLTDDSNIKDGQTIFIQQKKKSNKSEPTYKVKQEDNIWSISQKKGVRLSCVLKMNKLEPGQEPAPGEKVYLKGKSPTHLLCRTIQMPDSHIDNKKITVVKDTIVRARDTIYPTIKEETKLSVDSNKVLGWESETKLLEKPTIISSTENNIAIQEISTRTLTTEEFAKEPIIAKETPTVYPKVIDYTALPKSKTGTHLVVKGDTMYNISKRYNISITQIVEWNNLSDQSVKLGQVLKIQQ